MSDCRKHKMALPELGEKKWRCRVVEKTKCRKQNQKELKMSLLTIEKRYSFSVLFFLFFSFLFSFLSLGLFSLFLRKEKKKKTKRVEEKEEGFPPGPPVSLCKK